MLSNRYKIEPIPAQDINLKIALSNDNTLSGLGQSIEDYAERETGLSINPVDDLENLRYLPTNETTMTFEFYSGNTYYTNLFAAGFDESEIGFSDPILSSFYLLTLFDDINRTSQIKLNNGFFDGFTFIEESATTIYNIDSSDEFSNLYISNDFVNGLTGITTLHFTLSFYNGKTGEVQLFFNSEKEATGDTTQNVNYFELELNPSGKTYTWNSTINAKEFTNTGFTESYNETIDSFENQKAIYPSGNAVSGNTYITL
jgi:hypothetical protein